MLRLCRIGSDAILDGAPILDAVSWRLNEADVVGRGSAVLQELEQIRKELFEEGSKLFDLI